MIPFTSPNDNRLRNFISSGGRYGIKSAVADKSYAEALFYGINSALDNFNFDPDESNIMLVVGDCGNALNDTKAPTHEALAKKISDKGVNLISFQVRNLDMDAWNLFNRQMILLNRNALQIRYDAGQQSISRVRATATNDGQIFKNDKQVSR